MTDLGIPRNGDFIREFRLLGTDLAPIDLTGHVLAAQARELAGTGAIVATATINIVEPTDGRFTLTWRGADFDGYGEPTAVSSFAYDIKHTYPDGLAIVPVRGHLMLIPEATP